MLEKENLRKADVYSGAVISLFGLWIVLQAIKMPMKDSWGGVQNVWYVSPAIFPLFSRLHHYAAGRTAVPNRIEDHRL
jgi:hypothetical protein